MWDLRNKQCTHKIKSKETQTRRAGEEGGRQKQVRETNRHDLPGTKNRGEGIKRREWGSQSRTMQ